MDATSTKTPARLVEHLRSWAGVWPPPEAGVTVVANPLNALPGWDGSLHPVTGVVDASGSGVLAVPPKTYDLVSRDAPVADICRRCPDWSGAPSWRRTRPSSVGRRPGGPARTSARGSRSRTRRSRTGSSRSAALPWSCWTMTGGTSPASASSVTTTRAGRSPSARSPLLGARAWPAGWWPRRRAPCWPGAPCRRTSTTPTTSPRRTSRKPPASRTSAGPPSAPGTPRPRPHGPGTPSPVETSFVHRTGLTTPRHGTIDGKRGGGGWAGSHRNLTGTPGAAYSRGPEDGPMTTTRTAPPRPRTGRDHGAPPRRRRAPPACSSSTTSRRSTDLLSMALRYEGWEVRTAADGLTAVRAAREFRPDAVVLDIMLPDLDGLEVLRRLRADDHRGPVLFLTAKDAVEDRIAGLTAGGDDYVTKPFSLEEARRPAARPDAPDATSCVQPPESQLVVGDLVLDEDSHEVTPRRRAHRADGDRVRAAALPDAQPAPRAVARRRSSTGSGTTTSAARPTSSSSTSPTCARRSTPAATPMIHTMRGAGYVLKPAE